MIDLIVDSIKVSGPKVDGSFSVTLNVGEHQQKNLALLLGIPQNQQVKVTVKKSEEVG